MLGDIDCRTAIFAADREALQHAHRQQQIGGVQSIESESGNKPMAKVATPMIVMVTRNVRLRPVRSPNQPNTIAPNGRTANPAGERQKREDKALCLSRAGKEMFGDDRGE